MLCFVLYLPCIFEENYISTREMEVIKNMVVKVLLTPVELIPQNHNFMFTNFKLDEREGEFDRPMLSCSEHSL